MGLFTRLRMTAFGQAVIDMANDPAYDEWTFSRKVRHALDQETTARAQRRVVKLLKESKTPNPAA
ncbi:ATP-binding protein, partial [Paeniglutamicibacter sulfureus]